MNRPKAIYFSMLQYQPSNLDLIKDAFDLKQYHTPDDLRDRELAGCEVVFAPLGYMFDGAFFDRVPGLKVIVSNTTGIPHIDAEEAAGRGISVVALHDDQEFLESITPTAEHTIGLMVAAARRLPSAHRAAAEGKWDRRPWGSPRMLSRMRLGIVGYGRLGRMVCRIAKVMGMETAYFDPFVPGGESSILALATNADVLSIHAKVTPESTGLVSREVLEALPRGAIVVNTARGEILDSDALIDLLESGHLWAAALDTISGEFSPGFAETFGSSRLARYARERDNLILTPHIGGSTYDAWFATERRVIDRALGLIGGSRGQGKD